MTYYCFALSVLAVVLAVWSAITSFRSMQRTRRVIAETERRLREAGVDWRGL